MNEHAVTVNGEVKEAVDTVDYAMQSLLSLWDTLPSELQALLLSVFTISILMQWLKKALLAELPKRQRVKWLWLASLPLGMALATIGLLLTRGDIEVVYWGLIGLTSGAIAMGAHYVTLKLVVPLARILWDRVLLLVRGR